MAKVWNHDMLSSPWKFGDEAINIWGVREPIIGAIDDENLEIFRDVLWTVLQG